MLSRRTLLGASAAAVAVAASPVMTHAGDADQFRSWKRQSEQAWARANHPDATERQTRRWCLKANDLDGLICETPAQSREAVLIKLETLERIATENLDDGYAVGMAQVRTFILNGGLN
ncbi:hypothetical protein [Brevundimonas nasdae]|uniref:hypothetical protein n=1 Tax=Brevundimonas nasdae TaxID=172043 RepID=UPI0028994F7F|nr:hypothetical protein [Brevundimonas nasdae]